MDAASSPTELVELDALIDRWLIEQLDSNDSVAAVERSDTDDRVWFVRVLGEDKDSYTVQFALGQRTLSFETYFMPAPPENREECYAHLLKRNASLFGMAFCIGEEDAVFLSGQLAHSELDPPGLDRILGTIYATVELCFQAALRIGYRSQFEDR